MHSLLLQAPQFLILTVFLVISLAWWSRHPKASALALAGAIALLVDTAGSIAFYAWLPQSAWFQSMASNATMSDRIYDAVAVVDSTLNSVGLGLCFAAVFVGRQTIGAAFPVQPSPMAPRAGATPPPLPLPRR